MEHTLIVMMLSLGVQVETKDVLTAITAFTAVERASKRPAWCTADRLVDNERNVARDEINVINNFVSYDMQDFGF